MWYKVVLYFDSVNDITQCDHSKAFKQFFPVVLFITLYKVILKLIHC